MDNVATHEDWKVCFSELGPGLLLFARQWVQSAEPQFQIEDESQQALALALERLPNDQREVLVMKIWNELTFAEIADALGISQNTAASRYRYGLAALRKTLPVQCTTSLI